MGGGRIKSLRSLGCHQGDIFSLCDLPVAPKPPHVSSTNCASHPLAAPRPPAPPTAPPPPLTTGPQPRHTLVVSRFPICWRQGLRSQVADSAHEPTSHGSHAVLRPCPRALRPVHGGTDLVCPRCCLRTRRPRVPGTRESPIDGAGPLTLSQPLSVCLLLAAMTWLITYFCDRLCDMCLPH